MKCVACEILKSIFPDNQEVQSLDSSVKLGEHADCFMYMNLMGESCGLNCHKIMEHIDESGPLDDYDVTEDKLPESVMATLRIILQLLKSCGASGLDKTLMRLIYQEERLKRIPEMMSRICEISVYSSKTENFYYKK